MLLPGVCAVQCDSNMLLLLSRVVPPTPTTLTPRGQPAADDITTLRRLESLNVCWQRLSGCAPWLGLSERPHNDVNCAKSKPWARSWQRRRPVKRWKDGRDTTVRSACLLFSCELLCRRLLSETQGQHRQFRQGGGLTGAPRLARLRPARTCGNALNDCSPRTSSSLPFITTSSPSGTPSPHLPPHHRLSTAFCSPARL